MPTVQNWRAILTRMVEEHAPSTQRVGRRLRDHVDSCRERTVELPDKPTLSAGGPGADPSLVMKYEWKLYVPRYAEQCLITGRSRWEPIGGTAAPEAISVTFKLGSTFATVQPAQTDTPSVLDLIPEKQWEIPVEPGLRGTFAVMGIWLSAKATDETEPGDRVEVWGQPLRCHWGAA